MSKKPIYILVAEDLVRDTERFKLFEEAELQKLLDLLNLLTAKVCIDIK